MLQVLLQAFCISLFTLGVCFVVIELCSRFNRSFLNFGFTIILLSLFSSIDLWNQKTDTSEFWTTLQHIIFCPVPLLIFFYVQDLSKVNKRFQKTFFTYWCIICTLLFISGLMFKPSNTIYFRETILYYLFFLPYVIYSIYVCASTLIKAINKFSGHHQTTILLHFIGFCLFTIFAGIDLVRLLSAHKCSGGISFTIFGIIGLGIILTYIFTTNLIFLLKENLQYISNLKNLSKELETARDLSEIGKSTSIINHEIKNYCCIIKGYAEILYETANLEENYKNIVKTMITSIDDLSRFSKEILDFSRAKIITHQQLNIYSLLKSCVENRFPKQIASFQFSECNHQVFIHGDWKKIEHAFVNLFLNAFEAKASLITIRILATQCVVLVTIEDDGIGCENEDLSKLFTAFFTTKENGTGLGLATTRAIIEAHGGHISVVSKNVTTKHKEHGCIFNISFPTIFEKNNKKDNIVLIENKIPMLSKVIQTFRNINVNPHIVSSINDLDFNRFKSPRYRIISDAECISAIKQRYKDHLCYSLVQTEDNSLYVIESTSERKECVFSEEFILYSMLAANN